MSFFARQFQRLPESTRSFFLTSIYGLAGGLAAVLFELGINWVYVSTFVVLSHRTTTVFLLGSLAVVVVCSLGGGFLMFRVDQSAAGSGIPQLKFAFWQDFGFVRLKTILVKFVAGLLHVGGGMSLGREGPSIHIAGGVASYLSTAFGIPKQRRRRPAAAGAAAGLAAAFNTPLAAITFVLEEIVQDLNSPLIGSIILASVLGAFTVHAIIGKNPAFVLPQIENMSWQVYLGVPLASAFASLVGIGFQRATLQLRAFSKSWDLLPRWMHPLLGGLTVWLLGAGIFLWSGHLGVFGLGYNDLSEMLHGRIPWLLIAALLIAKWISTVACYGWGGCGGIFAPLLFLGAAAGATLGGLAGFAIPLTGDDQTLLAIIGMSACLSAVVRAPFTSILIVFEMTHQFALVPALMLGALVSEAISRGLTTHNFYDEVLSQDGIVLVHVIPPRDLRSWQAYPVSAIANFRPVVIDNLAPENLRAMLEKNQFKRFPVVDNGTLIGCLAREEAVCALEENRAVVLEKVATCRRSFTIGEVARLLIDAPGGFAVLEAGDKPAGIITLHDLLRAQETLAARSTH
ncbi:MAG TPA: chloride channel protein [Chthoniobacterales bacterium]|nr:chloride channel protein [Chthoniobacterales bacterium]